AVVRGARSVMIDEDARAAPARPRLELDRPQVRHILRADDLQPLLPHPAQIRCVLLGREFLGEFVGNGRASGHSSSLRAEIEARLAGNAPPSTTAARAHRRRPTCNATGCSASMRRLHTSPWGPT